MVFSPVFVWLFIKKYSAHFSDAQSENLIFWLSI